MLASLLSLAGLGITAQAGAAVPDPVTPNSVATESVSPTSGVAPAPEGSFGIQLLDAPVVSRDDPRASRYIIDHLTPGTTIHRRVRVANKSDQPLTLDLYPAAATIANEQFQFGEGHSGNELTGWISLSDSTVRLAPGAQQDVTATVKVDPQAFKGERYAVIWASGTSDPKAAGNVHQVHRVGVRVYLDVGPGGAPPAGFDIGTMTPARAADGVPSVTVQISNTGGRALDMAGSATLSAGPAGLGAGPFEVDQGSTLAPGETGVVVINFPSALPNGPWTMELDLNSGAVKNSATASITFPDPGQIAAVANSSSTPWVVIGIALAIGVLVLVGVAGAARRKSRTVRVGP